MPAVVGWLHYAAFGGIFLEIERVAAGEQPARVA